MAIAQAPQTPRQALLELLKATSPEQIDRHTPDVLLKELAKLPPDMRQKQHQSMMMLSLIMAMSPNAVQTFDAGPVFAVIQNPKDKSKVEITVERDDLTGDTDVMEFGVRITKDGQPQDLPFDPRLLIDMKLENNVWKLGRLGGSNGRAAQFRRGRAQNFRGGQRCNFAAHVEFSGGNLCGHLSAVWIYLPVDQPWRQHERKIARRTRRAVD